MPSPSTTAIVVTYRTGPRLRECLHVLAGDPAVAEVRIVDNGNPAEDRAWIESFAENREHVDLIDAGANIGFGRGVNLGAQGAKPGYLLIINPDAILKRGSVEAMIAASQSLAAPWIAGGKIFDARGREGRGPRRRKLTLLRALSTFSGWNTWTLETSPPPSAPVRMDVVSGALMLTDTASFSRLGGFDEAYFLHVEDVDLCRRAWEAGGEVVYVPDAGALHDGASSDAPARTVAALKGDSLAYYFRKFARNPFERALAFILSPAIKAVLVLRARDQG